MPATPFSRRRRQLLAVPALGLLAPACALRLPAGGAGSDARVHTVRLEAAPASVAIRGPSHPPVDAWAYGGTVPGPLIRARQGDRLRVLLDNRLPQPTTVHWHGLRVPHAMDGVPHVTQPPVEPGGTFTYEFDLPDAGTYWYHSHWRSSEQVERGLYGLLVVDEREPPAFDRELAWVLDDWRLARWGALSDSFGGAHDMSHAGRIGNAITVNGAPPADVPLRPGERVRLRLLNAANARIFSLGFDDLAPLVIAVDGHPVPPHPLPQGRVVLGPGMRCDLLLDAPPTPGRHLVFDDFQPRQAFDLLPLVVAGGPLREQPPGAPVALPANPLPQPELAQARRHVLRFEGGMMGGLHRAVLDGQSLAFPALLRRGRAWAINGIASSGHGEGPAAGHAAHEAPLLTVAAGETCLLELRNDTRWYHPIHLHGHHMRLLSRQGRPLAVQPWHDTVLLAPGERAEVAWRAHTRGDWMLHCHVLEHQDGGMMGVVRVT